MACNDMSKEMRQRVLSLYTPPFRYEQGYIWDSKGEMVADSRIDDDIGPRIRGWGRMSYLPEAQELYHSTGHLIAVALTAFWRDQRAKEVP